MGNGTYNGWSGFETWAVSMYLDGAYDGEDTARLALEVVAEAAPAGRDDRAHAVFSVGEALRELVEPEIPTLGGLAGDLLSAAMGAINWRELAESRLDAAGWFGATELAGWEDAAKALGRKHGEAAAAMGGEVPNLSGEWADSLTPDRLFHLYAGRDAETDADGDAVEALADAYEAGVADVLAGTGAR